jgi:hypothetical protein
VRPTVEQQLRTRYVEASDYLVFLNREALPFMRQARQAINQTYCSRFVTATTGTGVFTTIWTSPDLAVGKVWFVEATIMARATGARGAWMIQGLFYNDGAVAQEGATFAAFTITSAAFNVQFAIVGNHVEAQVQDNGVLTVQWQCWIELREHPQ